jgi:hypothetical protein
MKLDSGATWESLAAQLAKTRQGNEPSYVARIGPGNSIVTDFMPILWSYDPGSFDGTFYGKSQAFARTDLAATAGRVFKDLVGDNITVGSASFDDFDVTAYMQRRCNTVGVMWSAWAMMVLNEQPHRAQEASRHGSAADCSGLDDLAFAQVPGHAELGAWLLAIPANARQQRLARKFIQYVSEQLDRDALKNLSGPFCADDKRQMDEDDRALIMALRVTPPVTGQMLDSLTTHACTQREEQLLGQIKQSIRNARPRPRSPRWREIEDLTGKYLQKVIYARSPECLRDIFDAANDDLKPLLKDRDSEPAMPPNWQVKIFAFLRTWMSLLNT